MSTGKKIFLGILGVLLVLVLGVCGYAWKIYSDVTGTVKDINEPVTRITSDSKRDEAVSIDSGDPFSVLLLGVDTGDLGRDDQGRSDTIMVVTVSPKTGQTTMVSIARDTYTEIIGRGTMDKINHAYAFGGVAMSMATVENLLDIPIDHYVSINMAGLKKIVDAVGGIEVNNTLEFTYDGYTFPVGTVQLDGKKALAYSRMRYDDPNGDYGRQERQRKVVTATVKKAISIKTLTSYQDILSALKSNMKTDLTWDNLVDIQKNYSSALGNIKTDQLQGTGVMRDEISYQDISADELTRVQTLLKAQLTN